MTNALRVFFYDVLGWFYSSVCIAIDRGFVFLLLALFIVHTELL